MQAAQLTPLAATHELPWEVAISLLPYRVTLLNFFCQLQTAVSFWSSHPWSWYDFTLWLLCVISHALSVSHAVIFKHTDLVKSAFWNVFLLKTSCTYQTAWERDWNAEGNSDVATDKLCVALGLACLLAASSETEDMCSCTALSSKIRTKFWLVVTFLFDSCFSLAPLGK